jgi:hypothetical protein
MHPLDGSRLQITRARQHFDALKVDIDAFLDSNPYPVEEDVDAETGDKLFRVLGELPALPGHWSVIVSDLGNNARSALNYIIAELNIAHGGNPERDKVDFPIADERGRYWEPQGRRRVSYRDAALKGIPEEWRKRVDDVQPYRHSTAALRRRDPLALLAGINNANKHRELVPAYGSICLGGYMVSPGAAAFGSLRNLEVRISAATPGKIDVRAEVMIPSTGNPRGTVLSARKVDVLCGKAAEVIFGSRHISLGELKRIIEWAEAIVKWFEPAFVP